MKGTTRFNTSLHQIIFFFKREICTMSIGIINSYTCANTNSTSGKPGSYNSGSLNTLFFSHFIHLHIINFTFYCGLYFFTFCMSHSNRLIRRFFGCRRPTLSSMNYRLFRLISSGFRPF